MLANTRIPWWKVEGDKVAKEIADTVRAIEMEQVDIFDRFVQLAALYDPNSYAAQQVDSEEMAIVTENVIAANVDTVTAGVAATEVRSRYMTDGADWETQRRARHLEWYVEGLAKLHERAIKCELAVGQGATIRGTGVIHGFVNQFGEICLEHVLADDIVVPEAECRGSRMPRQMHRRRAVDRDLLIAEFPDQEDEIDNAYKTAARAIGSYRMLEPNELVTLMSYRLPSGKKGRKGYQKGRFVLSIQDHVLLDEPYEEEAFPIGKIVWTPRPDGWYGIGLAERIAGHQRTVNKMNWQVDRQLDQWAIPTQFVRPVDANMAVKKVNRAGAIAVVRGEYPKTVIPQAVSGETYQRLERVKSGSFEESGVSRLAAQSAKPAGLDSGIALREYRDQTTQRFAMVEKAYERLNLDCDLLLIRLAKQLGKNAPKITRQTRFGTKRIKWADVDMGEVRVQAAAASTLSRTPAGRTQLVLELAQAGIISQDETRRLLQHPDLERELSIYTAAIEALEHVFDEIADGEVILPEPYMNLRMCVSRGQNQYLKWHDDGAPESVLEVLRQFVDTAAFMVAEDEAAPGMSNGMEQMGGPPTSALSAQAMDLRAR